MAEITNKLIKCLSYDDLSIEPIFSTVNSRSDVDTSSEFLPNMALKTPIIAAPMSTICEAKMMRKMFSLGGLGILHRFMSIENITYEIKNVVHKIPKKWRTVAIGVEARDKKILKCLYQDIGIICIDLNIGHHKKTINMIRHIKKDYPNLKIIAGNVSTYEGAYDLCKAGADCIRATNGGGSVCTTLETTGVGIPSATSLNECYIGTKDAERYTRENKFLIADGGLKSSGDMTKAFAIGADAVMIGGLLAGSSSCPKGAFFTENGVFKARYRGMASREAQIERFGKLKKGIAPEGKEKVISPKGKTSKIIEELIGGIKSACSLVNAKNLTELKENAKFVRK